MTETGVVGLDRQRHSRHWRRPHSKLDSTVSVHYTAPTTGGRYSVRDPGFGNDRGVGVNELITATR